ALPRRWMWVCGPLAGCGKRLVERGFAAVLERRPQEKPSTERKLDGAAEALGSPTHPPRGKTRDGRPRRHCDSGPYHAPPKVRVELPTANRRSVTVWMAMRVEGLRTSR